MAEVITQAEQGRVIEVMKATGVSESEAWFIIAIESGMIDGDMIDVSKSPAATKDRSEKVRNYLVDDEINRNWYRLLPKIRAASGAKTDNTIGLEENSIATIH